MGRSILARRRDLVYLAFFLIHIPVMLLVDLTTLYPPAVHARLPVLGRIRGWYVARHADPLFVDPPSWFALYLWMEALYHLPLSLWAVPALLSDAPAVPLQLLVWSVQTAVTTATCVAHLAGHRGLTAAQLAGLAQLYLPYLALAVGMGFDMHRRLAATLAAVPQPKVKAP